MHVYWEEIFFKCLPELVDHFYVSRSTKTHWSAVLAYGLYSLFKEASQQLMFVIVGDGKHICPREWW